MQKKKQTKPIKQIIIITIIAILLLLLILSEDIIKFTNKNKINLAENTPNATAIVDPNIPQLSAGMIPIRWESDHFIITTQNDPKWYDYKNGKPAYIMLNDGYYQSELIRGITDDQLMSNAVGNDALVIPKVPNNNPTILMWIPRFAVNDETNEIQYIKNTEAIEGNWTIPEMFTYKQEAETSPDFLLTGIWLEKDVDTNITTKINQMNSEKGIYGFIKNTIVVSSNQTIQNTIQDYIANTVGAHDCALDDPTNPNRVILKIINQNNQEPIKAKAILDVNTMEITINITYSKNKITKIEDARGNILSENSITAVDRDIPSNGTYHYIITDELGNKKNLSVKVNITSTITYNINGGTKAVASITAGYGETIEMPIPERKYIVSYNTGGNGSIPSTSAEYEFNGWYTQAIDGEKREYTTMPKNNQTLYAQWTAKGVSLPNFPKEDYLGNWYLNNALTTIVGRVGDEYIPTKNITLYAGYKSGIYAFYYDDRTLAFNTVNSGIEGKTAKFSYGEISNTHLTGDNAPWGYYYVDRVVFLDVITPKYTSYWFIGSNFKEIDTRYIRTNNVTDMKGMFESCRYLKSIDLSRWNTSKVTDMSWMFYYCNDLTSLDLSNFNTSNVTDMTYMFGDCDELTSLNISSFNTSRVTDMSRMFQECRKLTTLDLSNFNTINVTNMRGMFYLCNNLTSLNLKSFNTSKVTSMLEMFYMCTSLTSLDLSSFNTNKVTNMGSMFKYCSNLKTIYVGAYWNVPSGTKEMFYSCGTSTTTRK